MKSFLWFSYSAVLNEGVSWLAHIKNEAIGAGEAKKQ